MRCFNMRLNHSTTEVLALPCVEKRQMFASQHACKRHVGEFFALVRLQSGRTTFPVTTLPILIFNGATQAYLDNKLITDGQEVPISVFQGLHLHQIGFPLFVDVKH